MNRNNLSQLITRIILIVLVTLNLLAIFGFSSQTGDKSEKTSGQISHIVADKVVEDYAEKAEDEKVEIRKRFDLKVRKTAHLIEYGTLGTLVFLLLLTWKWNLLLQYAASLLSVVLVAIVDEMLFQSLTDGRAALWQDVWIDTAGAAFCTAFVLLLVLLARLVRLLTKRRSA